MNLKEFRKDLKNYKYEDYKDQIKSNCVSCGEKIPRKPKSKYMKWSAKFAKWRNFILWGNYCWSCNKRHNQAVRSIKKNALLSIEKLFGL